MSTNASVLDPNGFLSPQTDTQLTASGITLDSHQRLYWIAAVVLWLICFLLRPLALSLAPRLPYADGHGPLGGVHANGTGKPNAPTEEGLEAPNDIEDSWNNDTTPRIDGTQAVTTPPYRYAQYAQRLPAAYTIVRDNLLALVCALVVNSFSQSLTLGVEIVAWIFLATTLAWGTLIVALDSRWVDIVFSVFSLGLGFAVLLISFLTGFK
ncbi:hypothetical protein BZG36_02201 [Bifiguratus adelaidae]|uniref:Uncharacterized protein n=1 Tax=Bifiguratus adelaidae TaxID=1938954 RepID=A0A261Y3J6_9FUNG|nr:hypothetical protein BZG36_02201 [Bifiguratus adelaidae]